MESLVRGLSGSRTNPVGRPAISPLWINPRPMLMLFACSARLPHISSTSTAWQTDRRHILFVRISLYIFNLRIVDFAVRRPSLYV
jgi:hypothetical protein